jgi:hypothetical protein
MLKFKSKNALEPPKGFEDNRKIIRIKTAKGISIKKYIKKEGKKIFIFL